MPKKIFVVAKIAQTLDGKIATASGESKWITSGETRQFARRRRDGFDAILVGSNTALKDNPLLTGVKNKILKKIIVDTNLLISPKANLFKNTRLGQCIIAVTSKAPTKRIKFFKNKGVIICVCRSTQGRIDLKDLFKKLSALGIKKILIEGGAKMVGAALKAGLVDAVNIYLSPSIMGDRKALSSVVGFNINNLNKMLKLTNLKIQRISTDILIEAHVHPVAAKGAGFLKG